MRFRSLIAAVPLATLMAFLSFLLPLIPFAQAPSECLINADFAMEPRPDGVATGWKVLHGGTGASFRWKSGTWEDEVESAPGSGTTVLLTSLSRSVSGGAAYAGLYQSTRLLPGADYRMVIRGQLHSGRADGMVACPGCRVQWAFVAGGDLPAGQGEWMDVPLDSSGERWVFHHGVDVTTGFEHVTLFVRVLQDPIASGAWVALELDEVSLQGPCGRR